jgi:hypothetical protein
VPDEVDIHKPRSKESIRTGFSIQSCSLDRYFKHRIVVVLSRQPEEYVCPGVNEEPGVRFIGHLSSARNAICLIAWFPEFPIGWKAVFQIATCGATLDGHADGHPHYVGCIAIATF